MSFQVDTALVQSYKNYITVKYQQFRSRLRPYVRFETQNAEYDYYDRVTSTTVNEMTSRHTDTPLISTPHDRRRVGLRDFNWADLIDRKDRIRMLADPQGPYVQNAIAAFERQMDQVLIDAAYGTAYSGKTGATAVTFPAANIIAVNATGAAPAGSGANTNLTIDKLRITRYKLMKAEAANEQDRELICVCDPSQIEAMLSYVPVTSTFYNSVRALVDGEVDKFMGFTFIWSNLLPTNASGYRQVLCFEKQGLLLSSAMEPTVDVGPRRDKNNSIQLYVEAHFGAVRMWEEKVYQILCDETTLGNVTAVSTNPVMV